MFQRLRNITNNMTDTAIIAMLILTTSIATMVASSIVIKSKDSTVVQESQSLQLSQNATALSELEEIVQSLKLSEVLSSEEESKSLTLWLENNYAIQDKDEAVDNVFDIATLTQPLQSDINRLKTEIAQMKASKVTARTDSEILALIQTELSDTSVNIEDDIDDLSDKVDDKLDLIVLNSNNIKSLQEKEDVISYRNEIILSTSNIPPDGYIACLEGYFLRGASQDDSVDPDGPRDFGSIQEYSDNSHEHSYSRKSAMYAATVLGEKYRDLVSNIDGYDQETETRPVNVAVHIYCQI